MSSRLLSCCQYETNKLVRIESIRLGSLKWTLNGVILMFICMMLLWNKSYQEFDLVVSSVTTKVKGVAMISLPGVLDDVVWDVVDYSGPVQEKNSFFVVTNVIVTKNQKQGKCPEVLPRGKLCRTDKDCEKGAWDQHSHGLQTGSCVKADVTKKTCEVSAWCPVEARTKPPRPALLAAAENFTVLIKNNIRFPAFNYIRRNILSNMNDAYLKSCQRRDDPLCPIFRLGDIVKDAGETFSQMAVEGGVIAIQINWDCNLDRLVQRCLPKYSFRRLDEKESNKTLYPGLNFRFARYASVNGVEERTLYKAFGIRFDVMVFGKAGRFSFIQLIIYIGSTLSYYALTTVFIDWLIGTSCYTLEARQNYSEKKVEPVHDKEQCILAVSFVDENHVWLVRRSHKKCLQDIKPMSIQQYKEDAGRLAMVGALQHGLGGVERCQPQAPPTPSPIPGPPRGPAQAPVWCRCGCCAPPASSVLLPQEQLCCRKTPGPCITSSPVFEQVVTRRSLLETIVLYRDPLRRRVPAESADDCRLTEDDDVALLRHCAYGQYVSWRVGVPPADTHPVAPSCCVARIRKEYPSPDGRYSGFRPTATMSRTSPK